MQRSEGDAALIAVAVRLGAEGKSQRQIAAALGKPRHWVRFTALAAERQADQAITDVPLRAVRAHPRARSIDVAHVHALVRSISAVGLLEPVIMRHSGEGFEVMAGLHRVAAFRELGRETVPTIIQDVDDLTAELVLIDENLCRHDLSPAERAMAVTRRKEIYLQMHPETAHGGDRRSAGSSRRSGDLKGDRFTKATAAATGVGERTVQRDAARGEKLGDDVLRRVTRTALDKGEELDALVKLSPQRREVLIERAVVGETVTAVAEVKREARDTREAKLGKKIADGSLDLAEKQYGVIVADPAWGRTVFSEITGMDRHAGNHYPTAHGTEETQDDAIKALPVGGIAAADCVLGLWCTEPWRGEAVMRAWRFEPKAYFVWVKDIIVLDPANNGMLRSGQWLEVVGAAGMGFWNRDRCEIMLIGVRGKPVCPAPGTQGERAWFARRGEHAAVREDVHSDKPDCALEWFERHWPNTPKIELNARRRRPGWAAWGLDVIDELLGTKNQAG
jgi:N6-adenosine-specific RNA methylase IME4